VEKQQIYTTVARRRCQINKQGKASHDNVTKKWFSVQNIASCFDYFSTYNSIKRYKCVFVII